MTLVVFTSSYAEPDFGNVDQNKFDVHKKVPEFGSLTVKDLHVNDSAIYFCSVSEHSITKAIECSTKT